MIVGVGGQGTLLASRIIGNAALKASYDVKVSEVHGMSQRGGSVVTYIKLGEKVCSPIIEKGQADILLAFEQLEALRWIEYLKPEGKPIINLQKINPMPVITGAASYPDNIVDKLRNYFKDLIAVDALSIARQCGNIKAVNVVLLGILAKNTSIEKKIWQNTLTELVPQKYIDVNIKAFEAGYNIRNQR